jgi:hypothetical protein
MKPSRSRSHHLRLVAAAVGLALLFTFAVLDYYRAFHFGVGAVYGAVMLGLPGALVVALLIAFVSEWLVRRRGAQPQLRWAILWMAITLLALFALEWLRTSDVRARDRLASAARSPDVPVRWTSATPEVSAVSDDAEGPSFTLLDLELLPAGTGPTRLAFVGA